jgi:hypothetical protein
MVSPERLARQYRNRGLEAASPMTQGVHFNGC